MKSEEVVKRNEESKARTINLPAWLWEILEADSSRCKRSITKHVEAILECYYDPTANVELNRYALTQAYDAISKNRMTG